MANLTKLTQLGLNIISLSKKLHRYIGGLMFKLLIMGILAGSISNLTGIPLFPVSPVIQDNQLTFVTLKVDEQKLERLKVYIKSKFNFKNNSRLANKIRLVQYF